MLTQRRRRFVIGISVGVAVATFLVLTLVPIPHTFSLQGAVIPDVYSCTGLAPAQGTTVSFHWSAGGITYFGVVSCSSGQVVYRANGTQGSGAFVSDGGMYDFGSLCPSGPCNPSDVAGTYTGPLLPL